MAYHQHALKRKLKNVQRPHSVIACRSVGPARPVRQFLQVQWVAQFLVVQQTEQFVVHLVQQSESFWCKSCGSQTFNPLPSTYRRDQST